MFTVLFIARLAALAVFSICSALSVYIWAKVVNLISEQQAERKAKKLSKKTKEN